MNRQDVLMPPQDGTMANASPLSTLLQQGRRTEALPGPGQVMLGVLEALPEGQRAGTVQVTGLGRVPLLHSLVPLAEADIGRGLALSLAGEGGALVLGLLWEGLSGGEPASATTSVERRPHVAAMPDAAPLSVTIDGHREVIEAAEELELRCGDACILLTADGRIQLRGTYITSHATATQRIVGGAVHVN